MVADGAAVGIGGMRREQELRRRDCLRAGGRGGRQAHLRMQRREAVALGDVVLDRLHLCAAQPRLVLPCVGAWVDACTGQKRVVRSR